jgi:hypothetical protein
MKLENTFFIIWLIGAILSLSFSAWLIYVIFHFVGKYW